MDLTRYQARIDAELELRLGEWFAAVPPVQREALQGILVRGKRLRGSLACAVAEALGGGVEAALPGALAVEIIQAASLVHDDLVDGDTVRRGRPAAWTLLSPRGAVLLADLAFATAIERMAAVGARECATVAHAIAAMAQGAFAESLEGHSYRGVVRLKTGSLFAAAARLGALAAAAPEAALEAATEFGMRAGELYQIADDLADEPFAAAERRRLARESVVLARQARAALAAFPRNEHTALLARLPLIFAPTRSLSRTA